MIEIDKIISSAVDANIEAVKGFVSNKDLSERERDVQVYKALFQHSTTLIENYHEALKTELATQGINI